MKKKLSFRFKLIFFSYIQQKFIVQVCNIIDLPILKDFLGLINDYFVEHLKIILMKSEFIDLYTSNFIY